MHLLGEMQPVQGQITLRTGKKAFKVSMHVIGFAVAYLLRSCVTAVLADGVRGATAVDPIRHRRRQHLLGQGPGENPSLESGHSRSPLV